MSFSSRSANVASNQAGVAVDHTHRHIYNCPPPTRHSTFSMHYCTFKTCALQYVMHCSLSKRTRWPYIIRPSFFGMVSFACIHSSVPRRPFPITRCIPTVAKSNKWSAARSPKVMYNREDCMVCYSIFIVRHLFSSG